MLQQRMSSELLQYRDKLTLSYHDILETLRSLSSDRDQPLIIEKKILTLQTNNQLFQTIFLLDKTGILVLLSPTKKYLINNSFAIESFFTVPKRELTWYLGFTDNSPLDSGRFIVISIPLVRRDVERQLNTFDGVIGVLVPVSLLYDDREERPAFVTTCICDGTRLVFSDNVLELDGDECQILSKSKQHNPGDYSFDSYFSSYPRQNGAKRQYLVTKTKEELSRLQIGKIARVTAMSISMRNVDMPILAVFLIIVVFGGILIVLINQYKNKVSELASLISWGDNEELSTGSPKRGADEIEHLSANIALLINRFSTTKHNLETVYRHIKKLELVKRDMGIAHQIQQEMIPQAFPPQERVQLATYYKPAEEVGGDLIDWVLLDKNRLSLLIADVSGKGIPAALVMAQTKILFRIVGSQHQSIGEIMNRVNRYLNENVRKTTFVTAVYGHYNQVTRQFQFANAGHTSLLHYSYNKKRLYELDEEESCCLGAWSTFSGECRSVILEAGDALLFYTDGALDAKNREGILFEESRLKKCFFDSGHLPADQIIEIIKETIFQFTQGSKLYDDLTLLVIKPK